MDTVDVTSDVTVPDDLSQVTEDVYRANVALTQSNKTLSLLRKIDDIILSTVTNPQAIAQEVANITAKEGGYKAVTILLKDDGKNILKNIAVSQTEEIIQIEHLLKLNLLDVQVVLDADQNLIVKAYNEKLVQVTHDMYEVFGPSLQRNQAQQIQEMLSIVTVVVCPLIVRGNCIGALVMLLDLNENNLSGHQHDLRERLPGVVAVAMDNALLYQQIQQANEKLQALDKLKDEFVSLASHELRTPMTAIKSYLWMALDGRGGATFREANILS